MELKLQGYYSEFQTEIYHWIHRRNEGKKHGTENPIEIANYSCL
jgi:hypothetical protein